MFVNNTEELAQNKILLLYIIDKSSTPLTNSQISEIILGHNYMNYFSIQQFLSELVESEFVTFVNLEGKDRYSMLKKGKLTLKYFEDRIPDNIKENINSTLKVKEMEYKRESQIIGNFYKKNDLEYIVTLKLVENGITLFNLHLNVPSKDQANIICNKWKQDPDSIYQSIFNTLLKDNT